MIPERRQRRVHQERPPVNLQLALAQDLRGVGRRRKETSQGRSVSRKRRRRSSAMRAVFHDEHATNEDATRRLDAPRGEKKTVGAPARRDASVRFSLKKKNDAEAVVASGRVVASVDICIVDLTVYRHNSLNSEGGACFQVTISRHVRRTRRGASASFDRSRKRGRFSTPRPIHGGKKK